MTGGRTLTIFELIETIRSLVEPDDLPHLNVCAKGVVNSLTCSGLSD